jgi:predicted Fe-Mo cluster-binding NifX family protein
MRIAIPTHHDLFTPHFGKSDGLFLCEYDPQTKRFEQTRQIKRQASGCESLPGWLCALAVDMVLAGGIGASAQLNLDGVGIDYSIGHTGQTPMDVLMQYINEPDAVRENHCHGDEHDHHHCKH